MVGRAIAVALLMAMLVIQGLGAIGAQTQAEMGGELDDIFIDDAEPWTDGFDDMSRVYVPPGGLIGTRVANGAVQLAAGSSEGWLASSVITCPPGNRYDLVVIDATLPGASGVSISVLDATAEATEVGYANATIGSFKDVEGTALSIRSIDPVTYPKLRLQVTLSADGSDRPTVNGWSLHYSPMDEWREEFVSQIRMESLRGLNLTSGNLELDLSGPQSGAGGASTHSINPPYPTIVFARYETGGPDVMNAFYANFDRTGYDDMTEIDCLGTYRVAIDDLDGDGLLDLVTCNRWFNSVNQDSQILWGQTDGVWTQQDATDLEMVRATGVGIGDLDGDGDKDLAFACFHQTSSTSSAVFLNQGNGLFNSQPDISFTDKEYYHVGVGDLNNDGIDDVLFSGSVASEIYYGGPDGPDTTVDLNWPSTSYIYDLLVDDLDGDGYDDFIIAYNAGDNKLRVYMGSADGADFGADYRLAIGDTAPFSVCAGDLDNDGYKDIVVMDVDGASRYLYVLPGTSTGWDDANPIKIATGTSYVYATEVADVNADGIGDLIAGMGDRMHIYYGGDGTFDTNPDINKDGIWSSMSVAVAVGGKASTRKFSGRLVTNEINLPAGKRWDTLVLEGAVPQNTSISLTVKDLSNSPVNGLQDLTTMDVDLSGLVSPTIRIELWLESDLNTTTPCIDLLRVKWQEANTWREQFFGPAKTARLAGTAVEDGHLTAHPVTGTGPDLLFATLRDDEGYNAPSIAMVGDGNVTFPSRGASAVATADLDGNGYVDVLFATYQTSATNYGATSDLFMGTPVGWRASPAHSFPTVGASDVLIEDINADGHMDVVFAQEYDGTTYAVNSTLFWGSASGWSSTPDLEFRTTGASGVAAADLDGDGDLDLAFSCYRASSTATDSMVFYQDGGTFPGTPDETLPTKGARAVAAGDLDGDGAVDLVFANSFSGGFAEIDSYVYWGRADGGFDTTPTPMPTSGAEDVALADLDGDGDLDVMFANHMDNNQNNSVDSYVYINQGGSFASSPDVRLPTKGASGVTAADIDGTGRMDIVFSCLRYGSDHTTPSLVFLGGATGWSASPDAELDTRGASDVVALRLVRTDTAGYLSKAITPADPGETGAFETLLYTAHMTGTRGGTISLVDAETWDVLASADLEEGPMSWQVRGEFVFRDHPSVRVMVTATGLDGTGDLWLDNLWLNWSKRVHRAPQVLDVEASETSVYRTTQATITIHVEDEYTPVDMLSIRLSYRLVGTEEWQTSMLSAPKHSDGVWTSTFKALAKATLGTYEFKVNVSDTDGDWSGDHVPDLTIEVLNRPPTSPVVQMTPARPVTTSALRVEVTQGASDPENYPITYHYRWYRDGVLVPEAAGDIITPSLTSRGENWTVEVAAFDGTDEGPAVRVSRVIQNAAPLAVDPLPDPFMDEDSQDSDWLDLSNAFEDPDGDAITWTVDPVPVHVIVTIDPATGRVTLVPEADWNGEETITFVCSDGQLQTAQTVTLTVHPINDAPVIVALNDVPVVSDPVVYDILQGHTLVITPTVLDVEGHELAFDINTTAVSVDGTTGVITFVPDNDAVGTLRFALTVYDLVSPTVKVRVNIVINVGNENDPMEDPDITNPEDGAQFKANKTFYLTVTCYDPDIPFGQVLNYTWTSSLSGFLGYGNTLTLSLADVGVHVITLTVTDGEFQKTDSINIEILPDDGTGPGPGPGPDDPDDGKQDAGGLPVTGILAAVLGVLVAASAAGYLMVARRRDASEEEEEPLDETPMDERQALQAIADMAKEAADTLEGSKNGNGHHQEDVWVETATEDGIDVDSASVAGTQLTMQASVTEAAPAEVEALFKDIEANGFHASEEDAEQMRLDNLKRKYHNTIGQLPYGIPSKALKDRDWNDLAAALAIGEKKRVEGDKEVTLIDGKWYYSDMEDASTFLKEHGAKPKEGRKASINGRDGLLAKLEERFILGEISEETYRELKGKYDD